jgi:two-component system phosphate regulon sensor histidine kinase PhoR
MTRHNNIPAGLHNARKQNKWQLLLMIIPLLIITGFQLFWLWENYKKEKRNLELRSNITFAETIRRLQAKKLNLDKIINDSTGRMRIEMFDGSPAGPVPVMRMNEGEMAGVLNDIAIKVKDSMSHFEMPANNRADVEVVAVVPGKPSVEKRTGSVVISMTDSKVRSRADSAGEFRFQQRGRPGEIFRFLYNVDSLQDSLRVAEVDSACRRSFEQEGLHVPFSVMRSESEKTRQHFSPEDPRSRNKVTLGFSHPVTYELNMGNTFGFIISKLVSPILFSVFLVGITILSFGLLYRNLQKQRRLTEIKNEFISNITHELKTPIATVGVAIEALRNFNAINDPQRTKEYLDISQNELQRLSLLVDKVLKLSMFENKEIELKYEILDLKAVVEEVVSSMKLQIEKYGATVSVNASGNTSLRGDKLHLLSVVFNLLDNALKYGKIRFNDEAGQGNTVINFELKEKENEVELSVTDNGMGISPEFKDKVFEKFFRVPSGDTHNTKGYGLGLSYVAHVIQKHKGKIELESPLRRSGNEASRPGPGTKFIISLPK